MLQSTRKEEERVPETSTHEGALPGKVWEMETHPISQDSQDGFDRHHFSSNENGTGRGKVCKDAECVAGNLSVSSLGTQVRLETMGSYTQASQRNPGQLN